MHLQRRQREAAEAWSLESGQAVVVGSGVPVHVPGRGDRTYPFHVPLRVPLPDRPRSGRAASWRGRGRGMGRLRASRSDRDERLGGRGGHAGPDGGSRSLSWRPGSRAAQGGASRSPASAWPVADVESFGGSARHRFALRPEPHPGARRTRSSWSGCGARPGDPHGLRDRGSADPARRTERGAPDRARGRVRPQGRGLPRRTARSSAAGPTRRCSTSPAERVVKEGEAGADRRRRRVPRLRERRLAYLSGAGKPTPERQELSGVVVVAAPCAIERCAPVTEWRDVHCARRRWDVAEGLVELGLLRGEPDRLVEARRADALFFPHGGHMVGLGIRDAGGCCPDGSGRRRGSAPARSTCRSSPATCFTVEPGIYFVRALLDDAGVAARQARRGRLGTRRRDDRVRRDPDRGRRADHRRRQRGPDRRHPDPLMRTEAHDHAYRLRQMPYEAEA